MSQFEALNLDGLTFTPESLSGLDGIKNVLISRLAPAGYQTHRDSKILESILYGFENVSERVAQHFMGVSGFVS